jgi:hypothetical protein
LQKRLTLVGDRHIEGKNQLDVAIPRRRHAAIGGTNAVQRQLARTGMQNRPLARDLLHRHEAEGLAIEGRQLVHVVHVKDHAGEADRHWQLRRA